MSLGTRELVTLDWLQVGRRIMIIGVCCRVITRMGILRQVWKFRRPSCEFDVANFTSEDVGTALYVAPELRSHGQGKYNEKVDVCSQTMPLPLA